MSYSRSLLRRLIGIREGPPSLSAREKTTTILCFSITCRQNPRIHYINDTPLQVSVNLMQPLTSLLESGPYTLFNNLESWRGGWIGETDNGRFVPGAPLCT